MLEPYRKFVQKYQTIQNLKVKELHEVEDKIATLEQDLSDWTTIQKILLNVSEISQKAVIELLQKLSTSGLQTVFGKDYSLVIDVVQMKDRNEIQCFVQSGDQKHTIEDNHGGSLVSLVSFIFRIVMICLSQHNLRKTVIMDEPFKEIDKMKLEDVGEIIQDLQNMLGMQFIIVTHEEQLNATGSKNFVVRKDNHGISRIY